MAARISIVGTVMEMYIIYSNYITKLELKNIVSEAFYQSNIGEFLNRSKGVHLYRDGKYGFTERFKNEIYLCTRIDNTIGRKQYC
ncbi:hypothetical protein CN680_07565 [Bacillus pseudomycoides]|nr:hypothetical protein CON97_14805 [Bacillus pseudomycoides]PEI40589.1 hypothetical protein CN620_15125 [Bacillus pseudomycoides]PEJ79987.1 hypothetical protein CN680_07565 [Bacillus pseudomycoides]PEM13176.1 hypothetical protein CN628_19405 [Bacillus pseudomycoides]PEO98747.1 hypothetical protein CN550_14345 [Bacillus pseudomycoides]